MIDTNFITKAHTATLPKPSPSHKFVEGADAVNNMQLEEMPLLHYFNISINGTNFHFNSAAESVFYHGNDNALIYFQDEPLSKFGWLSFKDKTPYEAGMLELFDPGTGTFLVLYETTDAIYPVTITEFGTPGEFISGHYSGTYTDAENNPVYHVACSFRVRRRK